MMNKGNNVKGGKRKGVDVLLSLRLSLEIPLIYLGFLLMRMVIVVSIN